MLIGSGGRNGKGALGRAELHHNPGEALSQRVVNLAGQAGALGDRSALALANQDLLGLRGYTGLKLLAELAQLLGLGAALLERPLQAASQ